MSIVTVICTVMSLAACGGKTNGKSSDVFTPTLKTDTECSITVAGSYDNFDALESEFDRFNIIPQDHVKSEIEKGMGSQFDERFALIMLKMIEEDTEYGMHE